MGFLTVAVGSDMVYTNVKQNNGAMKTCLTTSITIPDPDDCIL